LAQEVITNAEDLAKAAVDGLMKKTKAAATAACTAFRPLSQGTLDGNWKDQLPSTATIEEVTEVAEASLLKLDGIETLALWKGVVKDHGEYTKALNKYGRTDDGFTDNMHKLIKVGRAAICEAIIVYIVAKKTSTPDAGRPKTACSKQTNQRCNGVCIAGTVAPGDI
jgi:hypothetical protein